MMVRWKTESSIEDARVVHMSPLEYISRVCLVNRMAPEEFYRYYMRYHGRILYYPPFSSGKFRDLEKAFQGGKTIDAPFLMYRDDGTVREQEGYHRALVSLSMAVRSIPVLVQGSLSRCCKFCPVSFIDEIRGISPEVAKKVERA